MIRVGVIGASGYVGGELMRYLLMHPGVEVAYLASESLDGRPMTDAFPSLLGQELPVCERFDAETAADRADFFFQTNKNGAGMRLAPELMAYGKKLVDVPADFRLKDVEVYQRYYKMEHTAPELLKEAVYAVPELHPKEIAAARLIANPGCYANSAILALAPMMVCGLADPSSIIVDSKSGVSGAGRSKTNVASLFTEINEGFKAYGVATHVHTPEIEQELSVLAGQEVKINFTPHLIPMNRGILTTAYASLLSGMTTADLLARYREFYTGKPFVVVLDEGQQPNTKNVFGTNFCHIGVVSDERTGRAIVTAAIDNMGKGAAGLAVQNMNLMCGFDETTGLMTPAVFP